MPDSDTNILAIDLGTGGPKAVIFTAAGQVVAESFEPTPLIHTPDGGVEQDAAGWLDAIVKASQAVTGGNPEAAKRVRAVAIAAQWFATVAIDEHGAPLANALSWMDGRGGRHMHRLAGPAPRVSGYNPFKLARWIRTTGGAPSLQGHDSLAHVHLLRDIAPGVAERARAFIDPGGFVTTALTGRVATSAESATAFWVTNTRDIEAIAYDDRLLRLGELRRDQLPELVESGAIVGDLLPERATELGVPVVPVVAATPDIMAAAIGSGAVADFAAHLYIGTSGWLACHVPFKKTDPLHNIAALPSALRGRYLMCTEQQTAGEGLAHLRDRLLATDASFDQLVAEAAACPPGADGVLFTPWLNGERTPIDDRHARAAYLNLSLTSSRAALVRATLEGVALNARWMQEYAEKFAGRRLDEIRMIGGGALSPLWCQIFADVLDREIQQVGDPRHATARGAALLGSLALGAVAADEIPSLVAPVASFKPNGAHRDLYDNAMNNFKAHYKANRKLYRQFNAGRHRPQRRDQPESEE